MHLDLYTFAACCCYTFYDLQLQQLYKCWPRKLPKRNARIVFKSNVKCFAHKSGNYIIELATFLNAAYDLPKVSQI